VKKHEIKALVAAVPHSHMAQWSDLPSTTAETRVVIEALPADALLAFPQTEDALAMGNQVTANALLASLTNADVLHLACHGYQDAQNPLLSGFVMSDEMLTIEKLMQVPLPRAFMAFLSACETAKGDKVRHDIVFVLRIKVDQRTCPVEPSRPGGPPRRRNAFRWVQKCNRDTLVSLIHLKSQSCFEESLTVSVRLQVHGRRRWTNGGKVGV
jgi:hypothetical protein